MARKGHFNKFFLKDNSKYVQGLAEEYLIKTTDSRIKTLILCCIISIILSTFSIIGLALFKYENLLYISGFCVTMLVVFLIFIIKEEMFTKNKFN